MKTSKLTEEQIIAMLNAREAGVAPCIEEIEFELDELKNDHDSE